MSRHQKFASELLSPGKQYSDNHMVLDFLIDESSQFDSVKMDNVDFTRQLNLPIETSDDEEKSAVSIYKTGVKFC
jgi:hypothetical protein